MLLLFSQKGYIWLSSKKHCTDGYRAHFDKHYNELDFIKVAIILGGLWAEDRDCLSIVVSKPFTENYVIFDWTLTWLLSTMYSASSSVRGHESPKCGKQTFSHLGSPINIFSQSRTQSLVVGKGNHDTHTTS